MIGNSELVLTTTLVLGKKWSQEFCKVVYLDRFLNIFINDLFIFVSSSSLSNYADENTLYASGFNLKEVNKIAWVLILTQLQNSFMKLTRLLMLESVISCVLEKILEMKLLFSKV